MPCRTARDVVDGGCKGRERNRVARWRAVRNGFRMKTDKYIVRFGRPARRNGKTGKVGAAPEND